MTSTRQKVPGEKPYAENKLSIAKVIARHFGERLPKGCHRVNIDRWLKRDDNPFPKPDDAGRYGVAECIEWVEQNHQSLVDEDKDTSGELAQKARDAVAQGKINKELHLKWEREVEKGLWIKKSEHNAILSGLGTQTWDTVCESVERGLVEKLEQQLQPLEMPLEVKAQIVASAKVYHAACIDEMQKKFAASVEAEKK